MSVAETGDVSSLEQLLGERVDANVRNSCDWTPLMMAADHARAQGYAEVLALLEQH